MMKDEGPFVIEWVAHHLAVGFTDLVVYTNDCSDGTDDMLIRLEELGLCHHRRNVIPEGIRPQPSALNYAQEEPVAGLSDWVMVFDADEFLSIRYGDGTLDDLLTATKAQGANGIVVTWRIFGSGGVVDWSRAPVTEQYLLAAPQSWNKGWGVKTLFQFDPDHWKLGIHRPKMKSKWIKTDYPDQIKWLNGSGREMEDYFKFRGWRSITRTVGYDWVQLNHYAVKSVDSYAIRKMRGNVNNK
ncbi:MAG: glycosyltransferase family 2 protein, partial [Rhodobacteraceae bacterium]|nr:glycosyltransferase family 2 protein [Paracoccaceae bacterium]